MKTGIAISNEKSELSVLKNYSKQNCRYECKVLKFCNRKMWLYSLGVSLETQKSYCFFVFGRTCFFNAIKQFIASEETICLHCKDDCEYMHYHKTQVKEKDINYHNFNPYSNCNPDYFCQYLLDANNTIEPLTWYEEYKDFIDLANGKEKNYVFSAKNKKQKSKGLLRDHIVSTLILLRQKWKRMFLMQGGPLWTGLPILEEHWACVPISLEEQF